MEGAQAIENLMQVLESVYAKEPAYDLTLNQIYERIQSPPDNGAAFTAIRSEPDKGKRNKLKADALSIYLPSAMVNGGVKLEHVRNHTGYLFYDFDLSATPSKIEEARQLKKRLESVRFAALFYVSPSANGIHLLVKCDGVSIENHTEAWKACANDLLKRIGGDYRDQFDVGVKNVNRKAFISYDPEAVYRPEAPAYKFAPIGASSGASVESKITTPTPDPSTFYIGNKGKALEFDRFHQLATDRPAGFITRPYGELFVPDNDIKEYYYEDEAVGILFDTPLKFVELKDKFVGYRTRGKYVEGERDHQLTRLGNYFYWLNPEASDRDILNYSAYLANWTEGEEYNTTTIANKIHGLGKRFDPSRVKAFTERWVIWNSDNNMKPTLKAILQKGEGYYKALMEAGEANIEVAMQKLIEQRTNQYEAITYAEITDFINDSIEVYFKGKASISRGTVTKRIQSSEKLLKLYADYNVGRFSKTRAAKMKHVSDMSYMLGGYSPKEFSEAIGIPERTIRDLWNSIRYFNEEAIIK